MVSFLAHLFKNTRIPAEGGERVSLQDYSWGVIELDVLYFSVLHGGIRALFVLQVEVFPIAVLQLRARWPVVHKFDLFEMRVCQSFILRRIHWHSGEISFHQVMEAPWSAIPTGSDIDCTNTPEAE